jgi:predicted SAM-dependent methyltransferase
MSQGITEHATESMTLKQLAVANFDPRIRKALKNLYDEWRILWNHRKGVRCVRQHLNATGPLRVQFGCGAQPKQGWLNTDMWPGPWATPDLCLDVSRELPFASDSVAEIYSEHMFEHLDYPSAACLFLTECLRVLEPGGAMTIGVPDVDAIYDRYQRLTSGAPSSLQPDAHFVIGHPLEELNFCFHQGGEHKFLYNEQFLIRLLVHFGFCEPRRRVFDPKMDSEHRREGTLYVVATKP